MKKRSRETLSPDLTPLIDVVFLLLIFFMVSTVFKKEELAKEAGDVLCMIDLMVEFGWLTQEQLDNRIPIKRNKLKIYSDILK